MARPTKKAKAVAEQQAFLERVEKRKKKLQEELKIAYGPLTKMAK